MKKLQTGVLLASLFILGHVKLGYTAQTAHQTGLKKLPSATRFSSMLPGKKPCSTRQNVQGRLGAKALKSPVSSTPGLIVISATDPDYPYCSINAMSKDGNWALGNFNGYPAIFDMLGNATTLSNLGTNVRGPNNCITGMTSTGILCGNIQPPKGPTTQTIMPFYSTDITSVPTIIPTAISSSYLTGMASDIDAKSTSDKITICGTISGEGPASQSSAFLFKTAPETTPTLTLLSTDSGYSSLASSMTRDATEVIGAYGVTGTTTFGGASWAGPNFTRSNMGSALSPPIGPQSAITPSGFRTVGWTKTSPAQAMVSSLTSVTVDSTMGTTTFNYMGASMPFYPIPTLSYGLAVSADSNLWGGMMSPTSGVFTGFVANDSRGYMAVGDWLSVHGISLSAAQSTDASTIMDVRGINASGTVVVGNTSTSKAYIAAIGGGAGTPGPQGPAGADGAPGAPGAKGDKGDTGPQGPAGTPGGPAGPKGDTGDRGLQGIRGLQGVPGTQGQTGSQGIQGYTGPQGVQGLKGDAGIQGPAGNPAVGLEKEDIVSKGSRSRLPQQD